MRLVLSRPPNVPHRRHLLRLASSPDPASLLDAFASDRVLHPHSLTRPGRRRRPRSSPTTRSRPAPALSAGAAVSASAAAPSPPGPTRWQWPCRRAPRSDRRPTRPAPARRSPAAASPSATKIRASCRPVPLRLRGDDQRRAGRWHAHPPGPTRGPLPRRRPARSEPRCTRPAPARKRPTAASSSAAAPFHRGRTSAAKGMSIFLVHRALSRLASFTEPACRASRAWPEAWACLVGPSSRAEPEPSHTEPRAEPRALSFMSSPTSENALDSRVSWQKEEVVKEPYVGSFRNLLLYHPACVSVDEEGDRIFITDRNHHRIIVSNSDGMILDCIGSSPGFEDGEFESAKLLHPAASFYHAAEDCLYIVDSENHAVRKADFGKGVLETVYPVSNKKSSGIWSWITDKLGLRKEDASTIQDFDADSVAFPWHLLQISQDDLLVADLNFETSWTLSMSTGEKQDIAGGRAEVMESYEQVINEKHALLKDMRMNLSSGDQEHYNPLGKIPCNELVSSISRFKKYIVFCDTDGQRVLKYDLDTKDTSNIHFTNFGVLGLPYWFVCGLERVSTWGHSAGQMQEHIREVNMLPGRCNIKVSVDIPVDTELAAPLVESYIWRQVRGSGALISESDGPDTTTEKVGIAQQWYDEIDNLAFSEVAEEPAVHEGDDKPANENQNQRSVQFTCAINVSPGTCELVASVVLYQKIDRMKDDLGVQKALIKRIIQCLHPEEHAGVELLMGKRKDARDLVLMKPVQLRMRIECADHPAGATNKETISTESCLEINICLD